jgi:indole-3-glycerol phosphate synthase
VIQARAHGADAVLLITSALSDAELAALLATASDLGMGALVETHAGDDLARAVASGAEVIGVNARDLETLDVDLDGALARVREVPADRLAVLESGIARGDQVTAAVEAGASAILVGEALMRAGDPAVTLRELMREESGR